MKKINICFFALLILFTQVIICDNIIYFLKLNYLASNIIALVINAGLAILLLKKKKIKIETNFNKYDLIFLILFAIITIATIIVPDTFWDSYSYHIYLQETPFADKINEDFFPGRTLTSFVYPAADRIFNMFRSLLGFRLGTLPGYFLIVVMFYQVKRYLGKLLENKTDEKNISILSILPLGVFIILQQMGTYYIDNFSVVLLLEIIYNIIFEGKELFKNKEKLYFLAYIVGLAVCAKITNAVYVIGPLIYLLIINIKDIKNLKIYDYILLILTFAFSMLPYVVDSIIQTGSPVFPYYNTIFKSQYFEETNWLDTRYGPKNIIQFLLWSIYIIKHPEKSYEVGSTDFMFAIGYIISILYILYAVIYKKMIKKDKTNKVMILYCLILLYLYVVWEKFVIGYTRYAGIIPVLGSILSIKILIECFNNKKMVQVIILSTIICASSLMGMTKYIYYGSGYYYIDIIKNYNKSAVQYLKENIKKVFVDKNNEKYDIDGIWGVIYDDSGIPKLLNVDDRIVELQYGTKTGNTDITNSIYWDNVLNNDIYIPIVEFKANGKIQGLNANGFEITEIVDTITDVSFLDDKDYIYIAKVKYNEGFNKNEIKMLTYDENEAVYEKEENESNRKTFNMVVSMNGRVINKNNKDSIKLDIILQKEGKLDTIIQTIEVQSNGKSENCEVNIENMDYDSIKVKLHSDELKERIENHSVTIFNMYTK